MMITKLISTLLSVWQKQWTLHAELANVTKTEKGNAPFSAIFTEKKSFKQFNWYEMTVNELTDTHESTEK